MPPYFKPLRRKIGVATLVMACVFMAGWMRSFVWEDQIVFNSIDQWGRNLSSSCGCIVWYAQIEDFKEVGRRNLQWSYDCWSSWGSSYELPENWETLGLRPNWIGMGFAVTWGGSLEICVVPYWFIVVPLTLLSAWLLLSRTRAPKLMPPVPENAR